MDTVFKSLFFRQPPIHYVAPPICENLFSSSSGPVIILNPRSRLGGITGLVQGGYGNFWLTWGSYPGAICYSVYQSTDPNDPEGTYVLVAECIPDPQFNLYPPEYGSGYYVVTAITPDGETPFGDPLYFNRPVQVCPTFVPPAPPLDLIGYIGEDMVIGPFPVNEGSGYGLVNYVWFKDGFFFEDTTYTTKDTLLIPLLEAADEGVYHLEVFTGLPSACGLVSDSVSLLICPAIIAPYPDYSVIVDEGSDADLGPFTIEEASCVGGITYEWYKDNVFYLDTTATTQGALAITNAQASDAGEYTLHIGCVGLGCDEEISVPVTLTVTPVGGCGATPSNLEDVVWNTTEVVIPGCQYCTPSGASGTVHLQTTACDPWYVCCPCCGDNASTDMVGVICNSGSAYDITVGINFVTAGVARDTPNMSFSVTLDGVPKGSVLQNPVTDAPISFTFSLPPGAHTLRAYVTFYAPPYPFESGNSCTLDGTITWSPATQP